MKRIQEDFGGDQLAFFKAITRAQLYSRYLDKKRTQALAYLAKLLTDKKKKWKNVGKARKENASAAGTYVGHCVYFGLRCGAFC